MTFFLLFMGFCLGVAFVPALAMFSDCLSRWVSKYGFVFVLLFLPAIGFAQELPGTAPMSSTLSQYLPTIIAGVLTVLGAIALPLLKTVLQSLAAKHQYAAALVPLEHLAEVFVADLRQKSGAPNGAPLNLATGVEAMKQAIGSDGAKDIETALGVGSQALDGYLQALLAKHAAVPGVTSATAAAVQK